MVVVKLFATLRGRTGEKELHIEAGSVEEVFKFLSSKFGKELQKHLDNATVLVNGQNISQLKGRKTSLQPGDEVSLFPPLGGG